MKWSSENHLVLQHLPFMTLSVNILTQCETDNWHKQLPVAHTWPGGRTGLESIHCRLPLPSPLSSPPRWPQCLWSSLVRVWGWGRWPISLCFRPRIHQAISWSTSISRIQGPQGGTNYSYLFIFLNFHFKTLSDLRNSGKYDIKFPYTFHLDSPNCQHLA